MGLDMYLNKVSNNVTDAIDKIIYNNEIYYWRKCNQIHDYFIRNGKLKEDFNCNDEPLIIDKNFAQQFINDLTTAIADHDKAKELFPCKAGFFWGGTDYDEYYYDGLEDTRTALVSEFVDTDWDNEHWEYTCWW